MVDSVIGSWDNHCLVLYVHVKSQGVMKDLIGSLLPAGLPWSLRDHPLRTVAETVGNIQLCLVDDH